MIYRKIKLIFYIPKPYRYHCKIVSIMNAELLWRKNQPLNVGEIVDTITHLTFDQDFNQPLQPRYIPDSVTHLTFRSFNQPLRPGHIPDSVTYLAFIRNFDQPLQSGHIPDSVTHLAFCSFNQPSFGTIRTYS